MVAVLLGLGLQGAAVLGTDAIVGLVAALLKSAMFGTFGLLDPSLALAGLAIGAAMVPGAYVARWLVSRIGAHLHGSIIEAAVLAGGAVFIAHAFRA